jgi:hypothetical protein
VLVAMLTTFDNPFDPFDQWEEWYAFDESHGYSTSGLLARVANVSHELSDADYQVGVNDAVNELLLLNPTGNLRKVVREVSFRD